MIHDLVSAYGRDFVTHVVVSTLILGAAMAAAAWIRPLTARTRHAILIAGMAALALPSAVIANLLEKHVPAVMEFTAAGPLAVPAGLGGLKPAAPQVTDAVAVVWLTVGLLLLVRWWIVTRRLVHTATRAASAPPARTVKALEAARRRLGISHSIDLIASSTCEAPAVVRVLRPMIILPSDGCDGLDDEELESLLCHECAHVARHDNLLGVCEAIACSVFWFNPLVWLAHRRIAAAREAACDERVADAALPAETYVGALAKICRALLAPRVPAVSCMANAHLKERIQHLMSYDTLRQSAFSHRAMAAGAVLALVVAIGAAGVVTAHPVTLSEDQYQLNYSINKTPDGRLVVRARVVDRGTGKIIAEPSVTAKPGDTATTNFNRNEGGEQLEWTIRVAAQADSSGTMTLIVNRNGREIQNTTTKFPAPGESKLAERQYTGAPISMNLANADLRNVLQTFGKLTGLEIVLAPEVQGSVTMNFKDTPWDEALELILRQNDCTFVLEGNQLRIYKVP